MTAKQFKNIKAGDMVEFQKSGVLNGIVVKVAGTRGDDIIFVNPLNEKLCVMSYRNFKI